MAGYPLNVYINDEQLSSTIYTDYNYSVISTGLEITRGPNLVAEWSYSGSNQFLGFSKEQGATTAEFGVGSTGIMIDMQPIGAGIVSLYSVEAVPTVTYYKTSSDELTSIADAIRSKAGISNSLEFPTGFVNAITKL